MALPSVFARLFGRFRRQREVPSWEATQPLPREAELDAAPGNSAGRTASAATGQAARGAGRREDDLEYMKRCCDAELRTMAATGLLAAPYYFERVAVLSRKARDYRCEVQYCEKYLRLVEAHLGRPQSEQPDDPRTGPTYRAIAQRLPRARTLLMKSRAQRSAAG